MKNNRIMSYIVLSVAFVLISVTVFAIPTTKTAAFWIAYVFTAIAFALQIVVWKFAFGRTDTLKSKFLGIPLVAVGLVYLLVQVLVCIVFAAIPSAPSWIVVIVCVLILGTSAICLIGTEAGRVEVHSVEEKTGTKVFYLKALQVDIEMLAESENNVDIKEALLRLAEKIRFSDPMSNEALKDLETVISDKVEELKTAKDKLELISTIDLLLIERNKKAKILK